MIKKIFLILIILSIVILIPAAAQSRETLAVLDFTTEAVSATEMNAIVEFLSAELFNTRKYIVIDVSQRENILSEMAFSMSGCSDDSCALEIGKLLSAELIVVGNLSKVGSRYLMSVKMLQTETSRTMGTANGRFANLDDLIDGLEEIAYTLVGMEAAAKAAPEPEPVTEPLPAAAEAEADKPAVKEAETAEAEPEAPAPRPAPEPAARKPKPKAAPGEFNILSFTLSSAGAVSLAGSGVFMAMAVSDLLASLDAYDAYMSASADPGFLYDNSDGLISDN